MPILIDPVCDHPGRVITNGPTAAPAAGDPGHAFALAPGPAAAVADNRAARTAGLVGLELGVSALAACPADGHEQSLTRRDGQHALDAGTAPARPAYCPFSDIAWQDNVWRTSIRVPIVGTCQ